MDVATSVMLFRKQYLVSAENVTKLETLSKAQGTSAAEIVRKAIDAYDPDSFDEISENELASLVSERLKEAIKDTQITRRRLTRALKKLEAN